MLELLDDDPDDDDDVVLPVEKEWLDQGGSWAEDEVARVKENVENLEFSLEATKLIKTSRTRFKRIDCSAHVVNLCKFPL